METKTTVTIGKASLDTEKIAEALARAEVGETITYDAISAVIGRDVRNSARHNMAAARRKVLREERIVFDVVRGEGLRRLDDAGKVATGGSAIHRIRRAAGRADKVLISVEFANLSSEEQIRHNALRTIYNATKAMTRSAGVKRVHVAVSEAADSLPLGRTMALFQK